jgi:hypothetical protein
MRTLPSTASLNVCLKTCAIAIVLALTAPAADLHAQTSSVYSQLLNLTKTLNERGLMLDAYEVDGLGDSESQSFYFEFEAGTSYTVTAVCDTDCSDIDICLWDENDNEIECDEEVDDAPVVTVTPKWTGQFKLEVDMFDCTTEPCYFAVGVFKDK